MGKAFLPAVLAVAAAAACVPYPGTAPVMESRPDVITTGPFLPLDPGAASLDSLHFSIRAYGAENANKISETAEESYNRIMVDTNLFSFRPGGLYRIVVYGTSDEFRKKTEQPSWSGGVAVGNAIYTYLGPHLPGVVAHEMTHLIFFEYMGRSDQELRWINEGLAVYEEALAMAGPQGARDPFRSMYETLRQRPLSLEDLRRFVPATQEEHLVSSWYAQAYSMVRFMIERGGRVGFSHFLAALRDGRTLDEAMATGFPGNWRTGAEFEAGWRHSL